MAMIRTYTKKHGAPDMTGCMALGVVMKALACLFLCCGGAEALEGQACYRDPSPFSYQITRGAPFQHRLLKVESAPSESSIGRTPSKSKSRMLQEDGPEEEARPFTDEPLHAPVIVGGAREEDAVKPIIFTDPEKSANGTDIIAPRPFVVDGSVEELENLNITVNCMFQNEDNKDDEDREKCAALFDAELVPHIMHSWSMPQTELSMLYAQFQNTIRESNATIGLLRISRAHKSFVGLDWEDEMMTLNVSIQGTTIYDDNPDDVITSNVGASRTDFFVDAWLNPMGSQNASHHPVVPQEFVYYSTPAIVSSIESNTELEVKFGIRDASEFDFSTAPEVTTPEGQIVPTLSMDLSQSGNSMVFFSLQFNYSKLNDIRETQSFHINVTTFDGEKTFSIPAELRSPGDIGLEISPSEITSEVFPGGTIEEFMALETTGGSISQVRFLPATWDFALDLFESEAGLQSEDPLGSSDRIKNLTDKYSSKNEIFADWFHMSLPADINQTRFFLEESSISRNNFEIVINDFSNSTGVIHGAMMVEVHGLDGNSPSLFVVPLEVEVTFMFICRSDPEPVTPGRFSQAAFQIVNIGDQELDFYLNRTKFTSDPYSKWSRFNNIPDKISIGGSPSEIRVSLQYLRSAAATDKIGDYEPEFAGESTEVENPSLAEDGSDGLGPGRFSMNMTVVASLPDAPEISDSRTINLALDANIGYAHPDKSRLVLSDKDKNNGIIANRLFKAIIVLRDEYGFGPAETRNGDELKIRLIPEDNIELREKLDGDMGTILKREVNNAGDTVVTIQPDYVGTMAIAVEVNTNPDFLEDKNYRRIVNSHAVVTIKPAECASGREVVWSQIVNINNGAEEVNQEHRTRCVCAKGNSIDSGLQRHQNNKYGGVEISEQDAVMPVGYYTEGSGGPPESKEVSACLPCAAGTFSDAESNDQDCQECRGDTFSTPGSSSCHECPEFGPECANGLVILNNNAWCESCSEELTYEQAFGSSVDPDVVKEATENSTRFQDARIAGTHRIPNMEAETKFHPCPVKDLCQASEDSTSISCREGHDEDSKVCAQCEEGWARWTVTMSMHCEECWATGANYIMVLLLISSTIGFVLFAYNRIRLWNIFSELHSAVSWWDILLEKPQGPERKKQMNDIESRMPELVKSYEEFNSSLFCKRQSPAQPTEGGEARMKRQSTLYSPVNVSESDSKSIKKARQIIADHRGLQHPVISVALLRIFIHWVQTIGVLTMAKLVPHTPVVHFLGFLNEMFTGLPITLKPFTCIADKNSASSGGLYEDLTGRVVVHTVGCMLVLGVIYALSLSFGGRIREGIGRTSDKEDIRTSALTITGISAAVLFFPLARTGGSFFSQEPIAFSDGHALTYDYGMTDESPNYDAGLALSVILFILCGIIYPFFVVRQLWVARNQYLNQKEVESRRQEMGNRIRRSTKILEKKEEEQSAQVPKQSERVIEGEVSRELAKQPMITYAHAFLAAGYVWNPDVTAGKDFKEEGAQLLSWARAITSEEGSTRHGGWWAAQIYEIVVALRKLMMLIFVISVPGLIEQATSAYIVMMAFLCVHLTVRPFGAGAGAGSGVSDSYLERRRVYDYKHGSGSQYSSTLSVSGALNNFEAFSITSLLVTQIAGILMYDSDFVPEHEPPSNLASAMQVICILFTVFFLISFILLLTIAHSLTVEYHVRKLVPYIGGRFFGFRSVDEINAMLAAGEQRKDDPVADDGTDEDPPDTAKQMPRKESSSGSVEESKAGTSERRSRVRQATPKEPDDEMPEMKRND